MTSTTPVALFLTELKMLSQHKWKQLYYDTPREDS